MPQTTVEEAFSGGTAPRTPTRATLNKRDYISDSALQAERRVSGRAVGYFRALFQTWKTVAIILSIPLGESPL